MDRIILQSSPAKDPKVRVESILVREVDKVSISKSEIELVIKSDDLRSCSQWRVIRSGSGGGQAVISLCQFDMFQEDVGTE
ncbi:MAG: hypothetical protein JKY67_00285 [Pseudomonadales bacterium]|nr:hypothetical protein [Pseudomonadales bacterium]